MLLCERDEPVRELIVIRSAGVLRADGYGVFAARKIEPHAAHIHRDKLIDIARERTRAVADLFVYNKVYARRMAERRLFLAAPAQQKKEQHRARLVVDKPGLQKARSGHREFRIDEHKIAVIDAERLDILGAFHFLVEPHLEMVRIPRHCRGIRVNVHRRGEREDRAAVAFALAREHRAVFAVKRRADRPADFRQGERSAALHTAHHHSQRIDVRGSRHRFACVQPRHIHFERALVVDMRRIAELFYIIFDERDRIGRAAGGRVGREHGTGIFFKLTAVKLDHGKFLFSMR